MPTMTDIQAIADRIAAAFHPDRIILLGSHAYGTPRDDSDVDMLVVLPLRGTTFRAAYDITRAVRPAFQVDLIVRSPEDVLARYRFGDPVIRDAIDRGTVLYEKAA